MADRAALQLVRPLVLLPGSGAMEGRKLALQLGSLPSSGWHWPRWLLPGVQLLSLSSKFDACPVFWEKEKGKAWHHKDVPFSRRLEIVDGMQSCAYGRLEYLG